MKKISINNKIIRWSLIGLGGLFLISILTSNYSTNSKDISGQQNQVQKVHSTNQKQIKIDQTTSKANSTKTSPTEPTNNPTFYTNVDGNSIQSPTPYTSQPSGATAKCGDGSYSFSQNHRGTCSHHGGVYEWL